MEVGYVCCIIYIHNYYWQLLLQVTLGTTVLLSYSVFMLLIAENMSPTSEFIPIIGQLSLIIETSASQSQHSTQLRRDF